MCNESIAFAQLDSTLMSVMSFNAYNAKVCM